MLLQENNKYEALPLQSWLFSNNSLPLCVLFLLFLLATLYFIDPIPPQQFVDNYTSYIWIVTFNVVNCLLTVITDTYKALTNQGLQSNKHIILGWPFRKGLLRFADLDKCNTWADLKVLITCSGWSKCCRRSVSCRWNWDREGLKNLKEHYISWIAWILTLSEKLQLTTLPTKFFIPVHLLHFTMWNTECHFRITTVVNFKLIIQYHKLHPLMDVTPKLVGL